MDFIDVVSGLFELISTKYQSVDGPLVMVVGDVIYSERGA